MNRKRSHSKQLLLIFIMAMLIVLAFLVIFLPKNLKIIPGEVTYDESLTDEEIAYLKDIYADYTPASDVVLAAEQVIASNAITESDSNLRLNVLIPVTDYYDETINIPESEINAYQLIPLSNLTPEQKALSIDGKYYLETGNEGAIYRNLIVKTDSIRTAQEMTDIFKDSTPLYPLSDQILSINQTGTTALARAMQNKLNSVGDGAFFSERIADFLSATDLTHISNEVSFASDCNNHTAMTLCADPRMFEVIKNIGTDIVELTGNHNNDWGSSANIDTINQYHDNNIQTFGGGKTEEEAATPISINNKNTSITWIGINNSTSSKENGQGADGEHPGANIYDESLLKAQIAEAKEKGDFVIVDVQFAECYCYPEYGEEIFECDRPISGQQEFFRHIVDLGADLVVGTQAHQPQTFEKYGNAYIYYGLGNLFFDQTYWPGTMRSLILTHYFNNGKLIQTKITPTIYDSNYQTSKMDESDAVAFLARLISSSPKGE